MTIRISQDCIMSASCLKMQTFVSIQLTCRASETYYKLQIDKRILCFSQAGTSTWISYKKKNKAQALHLTVTSNI